MHDVRYALRLLQRSPLFALTAALSIAIGIGANTTIFTIANALLFRAPAGVANADRIVDIGRTQNGDGFDNDSYPNYLDVRARSRSFTDVYAWRFDPQPMSLGGTAAAERIYGGVVSNNYFTTLGVRPAAGRLLSERDGEVVVLSHAFWTRRFDGNRAIVGQKIDLNGHPFTVAGVAAEGFQGTSIFRPDLWVPMTAVGAAMPREEAASLLTSREAVWMMMGGRLKPGVTVEQAQAELAMLGATLAREYPQENRGRGLRALPLSQLPGHTTPVAAFVTALMVVVALVLTIACANVAGVLLARATSRRREIAVRVALGAGRARLIRQMLIETATLFVAGALLGLLLARVLTTLLTALMPTLPVQLGIALTLDVRVIAFTAGISFLAAILSGLVPAFHASSYVSLKNEDTPERLRLRNAFVIAQVALSIVLVVGATLFVRALQRASRIDAGFDPHGVEIASLDLSLGGYTDTTGPLFARELLERVRAIPGVENATLAAMLPLAMGGMGLGPITVPGRAEEIALDWNVVEPGSFATLRTPLLRGRDFNDNDRANAPFVAIINETMARRLWPHEDAIGKVLQQGESRKLTVVGVARDSKYRDLGEAPRNYVYVPLQQQYTPRLNIVARTRDGRRLAAEIRTLVQSMNRNLPIVTSQTLEEHSGIALFPQRMAASVSGSLGIVGLLLAAIGIYGVTAYVVSSRTREIGIRMALGAERRDVMRLVLRQGMSLVAIGVGIGFILAAGASRLVASFLLGIGPIDPVAFATAAVLFGAIGLAACYAPARRATRIEAMVALRNE